jgi:hypothetical protein
VTKRTQASESITLVTRRTNQLSLAQSGHPERSQALCRIAPCLALTGEARKPNLKPGFQFAGAAFFVGDSGVMQTNSIRLGHESNPV